MGEVPGVVSASVRLEAELPQVRLHLGLPTEVFLDEIEKPLAGLMNPPDITPVFLVRMIFEILLKHLRVPEDMTHRVAQIMPKG